MSSQRLRSISWVAFLAATVAFSAPQRPVKPFAVYHDGDRVLFAPQTTGTRSVARFGPWVLGQLLHQDKPRDTRLNLYVVVPGTQYKSAAYPQYDHNVVVNKLAADKVHDWDVYWCLVLDPDLQGEMNSERELLTAAQQSFYPADLFDVQDLPAREMTAQKAGVRSLADLRQYRRPDGSLPRMLILPAHMALRGVTQPEEKQARR